MKKETRIAILIGKGLESFRIYMLTVFRGKMIEGVEFYRANSSFELSSAISSSKYYSEIRLLILMTESDPLIDDDFYVRIAKPIILTRNLETIVKTYGLSVDDARALLNSLAKSTFLEIVKFVNNLFYEAAELLEDLGYGKKSE